MSLISNFMLKPINERFYGSARNAKKIENAVSKAREDFVGGSNIAMGSYGDKVFTQVEDAIIDVFGFNVVDFGLAVDPSVNAYTYPIATSITSGYTAVTKDEIKNNKYDGTNFCLYVRVTTGLWANSNFSDAEVTAIILHEIGHNFQHINNSGQRTWGLIECTVMIISLLTAGNLTALFSDSTIRAEASKIAKNSTILRSGMNIYEGITGILKYIYYVLFAVGDFLTLGVGGALAGVVTVGMNPLNTLFSTAVSGIAKGAEFNADAFVANFGYGPELTSALAKMELNPAKVTGTGVEKALNSIPILGHIHNMMSIPMTLLMAPFSSHPLTGRRMNNIISVLEKELKRSDLSPALKKEIQANIEDCKEMAKAAVEVDKDTRNINRKWLAGILRRGKSTGIISGPMSKMEESVDLDIDHLVLTTEETKVMRKIDNYTDIFISTLPMENEYEDTISNNRLDSWFI